MFKNYLTVAFRNFSRNKVFSFINIAGLAIGISASLVIYLIAGYEFSFDKFEQDGDRIYRVVSDMHFPDQVFKLPGVPSPMAAAVQKEVSGIEVAAPFHLFNGEANVSVPSVKTVPAVYKKQPDIIFADENYFKLFAYEWITGTPGSLTEPFKVVLTESRARIYFPHTGMGSVIGKTIVYNDTVPVTVAGVVKDLDEASEFKFKEFLSLATISGSSLKNNYSWDQWSSINSSSQFFIKLNKGTSPKQTEKQIKALKEKYLRDDYLKTTHSLQPLSDIHFNPAYGNFSEKQISKSTLYSLLAVAAFLLLLGCINFINLTTAQAVQRAKEIGIRKTMGSSKMHLILQFLTETLLLTFIATAISVIITPWLLKAFSDYIPKEVTFDMLWQPRVLFFIFLLVILVSFLSGFYPALVLTRFKPVTVLKNQSFSQSSGTTRKALLRKSLTVTQFIIAQFFIISTLIVVKQIHYFLDKDLGFRKDAIINIDLPMDFKKQDKGFILVRKLQAIPEIEKVSMAGSPPATNGISFQTMNYDNGKKKIETTVEIKYADSSYFDLYNMKLLAGKYLRPADSVAEYLINNNYAQFLGFKNPSNAIGHFLEHSNGKIPIVGVLADIYTHSLHSEMKPLAYSSAKENYFTLHIALQPGREKSTTWKTAITKIENAWKEIYPEDNFEYRFFDESIAKFYSTEQSMSGLLTWATGLAIFISCLGLLGLAIYTTNQRTKEIGVRKVLGASVKQIVLLLSKDFLRLILLAFIIATPPAWWMMHNWLQEFAYRTTLDWWVFAGGGLMMVIIAMLILSIRTVRAATVNPVESLRTE